MTIRCETRDDGANLVIAVIGELRLTDTVPLRERLLKCLAEQPGALLVDLTGLHVEQAPSLAVFTAVLRQAARWPGTPVLLYGPPAQTRRLLLAGAFRRLPLYDDRAGAIAHLHDERRSRPSVIDQLLPVSGSARHARDVATEACLRWDLPHLVAPASLIATELVANVIDHVHTMMTLHLTLRPRYLHVAVRDGSPVPPDPPGKIRPETAGGRGLLLVGELAHSWGWLPSKDGKVVWASLRR
ncbi:ATP-binding protein [Actinoplanes flavus]|uniref:ATP-binding protein n=1 Tax=Actinoplanes flavus TaxID=2820290 RepID=A0ABS3UWB1_9ACTN|nr:ATP-binding protein [Actinoplanes flavus]MBO3742856.1 ATP-binding protein [Actinoplanes flavus]